MSKNGENLCNIRVKVESTLPVVNFSSRKEKILNEQLKLAYDRRIMRKTASQQKHCIQSP